MIQYVDIMPRVTTKESVKPVTKADDSYTVTIPRMQAIKNISFVQILTVLLLVETFFLGSLYTKVQTLEKNGGTPSTAPQAGAQNPGTQNQPTGLTPGQKVTVDVGRFPVRGNAKVTVIEFADFRCPFCEKLHTDVLSQLKKDYIDTGKVKFYYRQYAFLGPASTVAANAAECAQEQGKFWDLHDYFFDHQPPESDTSMYTVDNLTTIAGQLGMDTTQFNACLSSNKYDKNVQDDLAAGQKAGVTATPTVFVNGTPIVGAESYAVFKQTIDQELQKS
jgi:protein-disulfide isomerase